MEEQKRTHFSKTSAKNAQTAAKNINTAEQSEAENGVLDALYKRAVGFSAGEVVEEYAVGEDGTEQLVKRRVKKRDIPPDLAAVRLLLEAEKPLASLTDEELAAEKERLLKLLAKAETEDAANKA